MDYEKSLVDIYTKRQFSSYRYNPFSVHSIVSRQLLSLKLSHFFSEHFSSPSEVRLIDLGCGFASHLNYFLSLGIPHNQLIGCELHPTIYNEAIDRLPKDISIFNSSVLDIPVDTLSEVNVIYQSMLLSSLVDPLYRSSTIDYIVNSMSSGSFFVSYDLRISNPNNIDVSPLAAREILSSHSAIKLVHSSSLTLLPPLARKLGNNYHLVSWLSRIPLLHSHSFFVFVKS